MSARLWKSLLVFVVLAAMGLPATGFTAESVASSSPTRDRLARGFAQPPDSAKPWAYWWWVNGNVTKESITRDLEAMKAKGFAGFLMFDSRGYHDDHVPPPPPKTEFMSDEWRELLKFAMTEANRFGLEMSVNLSSGAGALKGPWDVGDDAPKKLVWASQEVTGPKKLEGELPKGDWSRGWDVAIAAVRHGAAAGGESSRPLAAEVVDLSGKVENGRLTWDVPEGRWTVLRFACTTMEGHETDVDILSAPAVTTYFNRMGGNLLADAGPLVGKTLTHFYSVSWEGAIPTWTIGFRRFHDQLLREAPRVEQQGRFEVAFRVGWALDAQPPHVQTCRPTGLPGAERHAARRVLVPQAGIQQADRDGSPYLRAAVGRRRSFHPHGGPLVGLSIAAQAPRRQGILRRDQPSRLAYFYCFARRVRPAGHRVFRRHSRQS